MLESGRIKGVRLHLVFIMMVKDKGISVFDFSVVMGFLILSGYLYVKPLSSYFIQTAQDVSLIDSH